MTEIKERAHRVEEITTPDGRQGWLYSDGSKRADNGHLLAVHPNAGQPITTANAAIFRQKRAEKYSQAAFKGLLASARKNMPAMFIPGTLAAWALASEKIADMILNDDPKVKPRDRVEAYRALAQVGDVVPARIQPADSQPTSQPSADVEIVELIMRRARYRSSTDG
jgi:hypothetical protein